MMSIVKVIAKVISMAVVELLVVMLGGRTKWQDMDAEEFVGGVHVDKVGGRHVDGDQSCWSRWSSNSEKKKMLFWTVNTSFNLDIVINNDGNVDGGDVVYQDKFKDGDDGEGGCHGVNGRHVVNGVGVRGVRVI
jgi:hypothetical protein